MTDGGHQDLIQISLTGLNQTPTAFRDAMGMMGCNFIGPAEAMKCFGIVLDDTTLDHFSDVPFSLETLRLHHDTHVLIAMIGISIMRLRHLAENSGLLFGAAWDTRTKPVNLPVFSSHRQDWYCERVFAAATGKICWRLLAKQPLPGSFNRSWVEQNDLIGQNQRVAMADEVVYLMVAHWLTTGERLFERETVRCSSHYGNNHQHVTIGNFGLDGLVIDHAVEHQTGETLGLAYAWTDNPLRA